MGWALLERFIGLVFVIPCLADYLRHRHMERHGKPARAVVGGERRRWSFWRRGRVREYELTFQTAEGTSVAMFYEASRRLQNVWVDIVYHPERPEDICLASDLPPRTLSLKVSGAIAIFLLFVPLHELPRLR